MKHRSAFFYLFLLFSLSGLHAQYGGEHAYPFIQMNFSAKTTAVGMPFGTGKSTEVSETFANPSQLNANNHHQAALHYGYLFSGIQGGVVSYAHHFGGDMNFCSSLQYLHYGMFTRTDVNEQEQGQFSAADYALIIGWGRMLDSLFYIGANVKPIYSQMEEYFSFGLAFDLALTFRKDNRNLALTLMARNFGYQMKPFHRQREEMPFSLDLVFMKKLAHAPLTFYAAINHLERWDLRYNDPLEQEEINPFTQEAKKENKWSGIADNAFRHLDFGLRMQIPQGFYAAIGYSWKRHQELKLQDAFSLSGFSYGIGFRIKRFEIAIARNEYHRSGAMNNLSLQMQF